MYVVNLCKVFGEKLMKRNFIKLISIFLALTLAFTSLACMTSCSLFKKEFTVTFTAGIKEGEAHLADGYDLSCLKQTVKDASELILPKFVCVGAYHEGWDKIIDKIKSDTTVKAQWIESQSRVRFNPNAEDVVKCDCNDCKEEIIVGDVSEIKLPKHWTRVGYTLDETWGGYNAETLYIPEDKNQPIVINAVWVPNEYKISFVDEDGTTSLGEDITVKYGLPIENLPTPQKDDFEFITWRVKGTQTKVYANMVYKYLEDVTLQVIWRGIGEYVIEYKDVETCDNRVKYVESAGKTYITNKPTKTGYDFVGWTGDNIEKDEDGYYIPAGTHCDIVLTAQWQPKVFGVTLDVLGGSADFTQKQITYGQKIGELPTPTKDGYKFERWQLSNGTIIDENFVWNIDDTSVYIVAKYLRYYTIKLNLTYQLYENTKYQMAVESKVFNEDALTDSGLVKSQTEEGVYYLYNVLEGSILSSKVLFEYQPLDTSEYYASKWKYKKPDGKKLNVLPEVTMISRDTFVGSLESGVIELFAGVGAYWTPGYV